MPAAPHRSALRCATSTVMSRNPFSVRRVLSVTVSPGTRVAAHATSLGRVLLAWEPAERVEQVINEYGLPRLTPYTITDPEEFREILAVVREQGWSMVVNEREEGLISLSAPVRDHHGQVVAAVASSTSTGRTTPETRGSAAGVAGSSQTHQHRVGQPLGVTSPRTRGGPHWWRSSRRPAGRND